MLMLVVYQFYDLHKAPDGGHGHEHGVDAVENAAVAGYEMSGIFNAYAALYH